MSHWFKPNVTCSDGGAQLSVAFWTSQASSVLSLSVSYFSKTHSLAEKRVKFFRLKKSGGVFACSPVFWQLRHAGPYLRPSVCVCVCVRENNERKFFMVAPAALNAELKHFFHQHTHTSLSTRLLLSSFSSILETILNQSKRQKT